MRTPFKVARIFIFATLAISSVIGRPWTEDIHSDGTGEHFEVFVPDGQGGMAAQYMTLRQMRSFLGARSLNDEQVHQEQSSNQQETVGVEPEKQVPEEELVAAAASSESQLEEQQQEIQDSEGPFPVDVEEPSVQGESYVTSEIQAVQEEFQDGVEPSTVEEPTEQEGFAVETNEAQEQVAETPKEEEDKPSDGNLSEDEVPQVEDVASSTEVVEESTAAQQESSEAETEQDNVDVTEEQLSQDDRDGRGLDTADDASSLYYQANPDEVAGSQQVVSIQEADTKPVLVTFQPLATDNKGLTATSEAQAKELEGLSNASNKLAWKIWNSAVTDRSVESNQVFSPLALTEALGIASLGARGASADAVNTMLSLDLITSRNPHSYLRQVSSDLSSSDYFHSQIGHTVFLNNASDTTLDTYKARINTLYGAAATSSSENLVSTEESLTPSDAAQLSRSAFQPKPPMGILSTAKFNVDWPIKNQLHDELVFLNSDSEFSSRKITSAPAVSVDGNFYAGYYPEMDATAVALPLYPSQSGKEEQYFSLLPEGTTLEALNDAGHLSLMLIMPGEPSSQKTGGAPLAALESKLADDPENWNKLLKSLAKTSLNVQFPQLQSENALRFSRAIAELPESQLAQLFDPERADFSGVAGLKNLYLVDVNQLVQLNISSVAVTDDSEDRLRATPRQGDCHRNTKPRQGTTQSKKTATKSKPAGNTSKTAVQKTNNRSTTHTPSKSSSSTNKSNSKVTKPTSVKSTGKPPAPKATTKSPATKPTNKSSASKPATKSPATTNKKVSPATANSQKKQAAATTSNKKASTTTPQKQQSSNQKVRTTAKPSSTKNKTPSGAATSTKNTTKKQTSKPTVAKNSTATARPAVKNQSNKPSNSNKRVTTAARPAVKKPASTTTNVKAVNGTKAAQKQPAKPTAVKTTPAKTNPTKTTATKPTKTTSAKPASKPTSAKATSTKTQPKPTGTKTSSATTGKPKTTNTKNTNKSATKVTVTTNNKPKTTTTTKTTNKASTTQKKSKPTSNTKTTTTTKTSSSNKKTNTNTNNKPKNGRADDSYESLIFNRSFLYAVRHNPTGILMYIGRYVQP